MRLIAPVAALCLALLSVSCAGTARRVPDMEAPLETVRVMSFNLWKGGQGGGLPIEATAAVIRAADADVVGVQEAYGEKIGPVAPDRSRVLARLLGWHHIDQGNGKTILSRHEILGLTPGRHGAQIRLPGDQSLFVFNVHLYHAPYQPYQLLGIPYADAPFLQTEPELIGAATAARGPELAATLAEVAPLVATGLRVVLTGDFNEPSHLDWTPRAVAAGVVPMAVAYPASRAVADAGLVDTYRAAHPDETTHPGRTWTPITTEDDPADRHDRIDFVHASPNLRVMSCEIVGERPDRADRVAVPYPSDHRAVVAELRLKD
jgi:endonuclease/exonuclease/phosphatase family metal-dependent hydrolase